MPSRPRVLIVGAGIGGRTLAAGLQHFGIVPTVAEIDQSSLGRGLALMLTGKRRPGLAAYRAGAGRHRRGDGTGRDRTNRRGGRLPRPPRLSPVERPVRTHTRNHPRRPDVSPVHRLAMPGRVCHHGGHTRLVNGHARRHQHRPADSKPASNHPTTVASPLFAATPPAATPATTTTSASSAEPFASTGINVVELTAWAIVLITAGATLSLTAQRRRAITRRQ